MCALDYRNMAVIIRIRIVYEHVEGEPVIWLHVSDDDGGVGCIAIRRQTLQNWRRIYVRFGCMTRLNGRQQAEKSPQITLR